MKKNSKTINCFSYQWCKDYIKEKGYSQRFISIKTGIKQSNLNKYLNGKAIPNLRNVALIAKVLDCTVDDLIEEVE